MAAGWGKWVLGALLVGAVCAQVPGNDQDVRVTQAFYQANALRRQYNLPALKWNQRLAEAAQNQARRMAATGFFSHHDPERGDLAERLARAGIRFAYSAENLFEEQGFKDPVREAYRGWMESPGHRQNLLNRLSEETGIGLASRPDGTLYLVQIFLRRAAGGLPSGS